MEVDPLPVSQVPPFSAPPPEKKTEEKNLHLNKKMKKKNLHLTKKTD